MRHALVAIQWALALVLLMSMALTVESYLSINAVQPGFRTANVITGQVTLPPSYSTSQAHEAFFESAVERLRGLPGTVDASLIDLAPLSGVTSMWSFHIAGRPEVPQSEWPAALHSIVSANYCRLIDIPLLRGRYLDDRDNESGEPVVLISRAFAQQFFGDDDPVGRQLVIPDGGRNPRRIVGVVGDVQSQTLIRRPPAHVYVPFRQLPQRTMTLILKSSYGATDAAREMREAVREMDRQIPIAKVRTLDALVREAKTRFTITALVLSAFGIGAIAIAIAALYAMTSLALTWRLQEVAIRLALGASRGNVTRLFLRESMALTTIGVALGLALTWITVPLLKTTLFGVKSHDPALFTLVPLASLGLGLICAGIATLRIRSIDARAALPDSSALK